MYRHKYDIERRKRSAVLTRLCSSGGGRADSPVAQKKRERERVVVKKEEEEEDTVDFWWVVGKSSSSSYDDDDEDGVVAFATARVERVIDLRAYLLHHASSSTGLPRGTILFSMALILGLPLGILSRVETHTAGLLLPPCFGTQRRRRLENGDGIMWNDDVVDDARDVSYIYGVAERALLKACATYGRKKAGVVTFLVVRISGVGALRRR